MATEENKTAPVAEQKGGKDKKKAGKPRNYDLGNGVYRFSRSRMFHKKAIYKFIGKKTAPTKKDKKPLTITKSIDGPQNGETRTVLVKKRRNYYATQDKIRKAPSKKLFSQHKHKFRRSLVPGTVCILLAGHHKGKRVILLKKLSSGLVLVTGPYEVNGCPLRRIDPRYVIGTNTRVNIEDLKLPENVNDNYFAREKKKRSKKEEGDIFASKKEGYKVSDVRKADQKVVDAQVVAAIKKHSDKKLLFSYLSSMFGLRSSQYPHRLKF